MSDVYTSCPSCHCYIDGGQHKCWVEELKKTFEYKQWEKLEEQAVKDGMYNTREEFKGPSLNETATKSSSRVIQYSNYCVLCSNRASYIYQGDSLCEDCFKEYREFETMEKNLEEAEENRRKDCACGDKHCDAGSDWEKELEFNLHKYGVTANNNGEEFWNINKNELQQFISTQITKAKQETAREIIRIIVNQNIDVSTIQNYPEIPDGVYIPEKDFDKFITLIKDAIKKEYNL